MTKISDMIVISKISLIFTTTTKKRTIQIDIPSESQKNGTLSTFIVLHKKNMKPSDLFKSNSVIVKSQKLSRYKLNETNKFVNLLENTKESTSVHNDYDKKPITHILSVLRLNLMSNDIKFDRTQIPQEIFHDLVINDKRYYMPILHVDVLSMRDDKFYVGYFETKRTFDSLDFIVIFHIFKASQ
jgi:hypothetical protein